MSHHAHALRPLLGAATVTATALLALVPGRALAHEHRAIDGGKYDIVVGWGTEPPVQGQPNAATVRVNLANTDPPQPIDGAEQTLQLQVRQGRTMLQLPLHAIVGRPGSYAADLVPGQAGDAQLTLSGSINGDAVNEVFDTADGKFDAVQPAATAAAPVAPVADAASPTQAMPADPGQLSAVLDVLDDADLHNLDMGLHAGSLPAGALERVHQADLAIGSITWPAALQDPAAQLGAQLGQLHATLEAGDLDAAKGPGHTAHALFHQLSGQARTWLAAQGAGEAASPATLCMKCSVSSAVNGPSSTRVMATERCRPVSHADSADALPSASERTLSSTSTGTRSSDQRRAAYCSASTDPTSAHCRSSTSSTVGARWPGAWPNRAIDSNIRRRAAASSRAGAGKSG